jgi:hypothetical protein
LEQGFFIFLDLQGLRRNEVLEFDLTGRPKATATGKTKKPRRVAGLRIS